MMIPENVGLTFVKPAIAHKAAFEEWLVDWKNDPYDAYRWIFARAWEDFEWYVALCERLRVEGHPPELTVPLDVRWAFLNDMLVGELYLFYVPMRGANHIGYKVRPSARRRGIATRLLKYGLEALRANGITEARLTCRDSNIGSAAVIERCGGIRIATKPQDDGTLIRHYIISL